MIRKEIHVPTALHNVCVLDLSRQLPGPFCAMMLGDLGADVLTIAAPNDPLGAGLPLVARNKRHMTLNLKSDEGREVFARLVARADVVLEGFRPGVTAKLGIDYPRLAPVNPRLIYCSISGYGQDGPYRDKVGHDINYIGYAGVLGVTGPAGGPPVIPGVQVADIGGGTLMAVIGILAALLARQHTGRGQFVDIAMVDGSLAWNLFHVLMHLIGRGTERGRTQLTGSHACYAVYETRDGKYVTVGALEPHFWQNLCRHFGRPDLGPLQFAEGADRERVFAFFREAFKRKTRDEWVRELEPVDICFGPVNDVAEALEDPQLLARQMILEEEHPRYGRVRTLGSPIKLSDTPPTMRRPPYGFGEHTDAVLREIGYDDAAISGLRARDVV
jgi:crotonobetainyl-CoA:carnitine CoA-transferase CaiB-like acyl-CoA transferase